MSQLDNCSLIFRHCLKANVQNDATADSRVVLHLHCFSALCFSGFVILNLSFQNCSHLVLVDIAEKKAIRKFQPHTWGRFLALLYTVGTCKVFAAWPTKKLPFLLMNLFLKF